MCCTTKSGWTDTSNGCDGTFGGSKFHTCALKPGNISSSLNSTNSLHLFMPAIYHDIEYEIYT